MSLMSFASCQDIPREQFDFMGYSLRALIPSFLASPGN